MGGARAAIDLPVVDLNRPDASAVLVEACKKYGFFILRHHGVPPEQSAEVFRQSKAFFTLPEQQKLACLAKKNNRGYTPIQEETLDPANQTQGDTKEGYYIFRDVTVSNSGGSDLLETPNLFPPEDLLPGWRKTMEDYFNTMLDVGLKTARLLAKGIGLQEDFFDSHFSHSTSAVRLLHYSATVSEPSNGIFGCGAHTDYGMMTFLATDDVPGLQVYLEGEWLDVAPRPGEFIVNLGNMLQRWTNDGFKSTLHRVINTSGRERYSIPFFFQNNFDSQVEALAPFVSEENPARYPPIMFGHHLVNKYIQTQTEFADPRHASGSLGESAAASLPAA